MSWILLVLAITALIVARQKWIADSQSAKKAVDDAKQAAGEAQRAADETARRFQQQVDTLGRELSSLRPLESVRDAMAATAVLREEGRRILAAATKEATGIRAAATAEADQVRSEAMSAANAIRLHAKTLHTEAQTRAAALVTEANRLAEKVRSDAQAEAHQVRSEARSVSDAIKLHAKTLHTEAQSRAAALVTEANRLAEKVRSDAQAEAYQVRSEATSESDAIKFDAKTVHAQAQTKAEFLVEEASRLAEKVRSNAQAEADQVRSEAAIEANALRVEAKKSYADTQSKIATLIDSAGRRADTIRSAALAEADRVRSEATAAANALKFNARTSHADAQLKVSTLIENANKHAEAIVADAEARALEVAGDAYRAVREADQLKRVAVAMENVVEGYGDRYLMPTYGLLDQLGEAYGFDEAGRELIAAREMSRNLVTSGRAADCDYVETNRRETALRFVLDAFNGKVDTVLARVKSDNAGTLEQQMTDAFALVNHNGAAFRNARITADYLASRLKEVKWAASVQALKERDKEEQRRIREQIREEEKARREIDRALKEAAKEEDLLQKALQKVQAQAAKANDEQRVVYEARLNELQGKLAEAEARNQRALSMAQQTKAGHVYVISNVGSFGEDVLKVGMTRRLEPTDRIRELGDASVPFGFDIHAMIWTDDAPALERELHRRFVRSQINKVNPRKEFFRVSLGAVRECVDAMGLETTWTISAEATQYRETLAIERSLQGNTAAAQEWLRTQLQFNPGTVAESAENESEVGETVS